MKRTSMKVTVDGFEIEIKAKDVETIFQTMNLFSLYAGEAAERYKSIELDGLADTAKKVGDEIFNQLDAAGCYE